MDTIGDIISERPLQPMFLCLLSPCIVDLIITNVHIFRWQQPVGLSWRFFWLMALCNHCGRKVGAVINNTHLTLYKAQAFHLVSALEATRCKERQSSNMKYLVRVDFQRIVGVETFITTLYTIYILAQLQYDNGITIMKMSRCYNKMFGRFQDIHVHPVQQFL